MPTAAATSLPHSKAAALQRVESPKHHTSRAFGGEAARVCAVGRICPSSDHAGLTHQTSGAHSKSVRCARRIMRCHRSVRRWSLPLVDPFESHGIPAQQQTTSGQRANALHWTGQLAASNAVAACGLEARCRRCGRRCRSSQLSNTRAHRNRVSTRSTRLDSLSTWARAPPSTTAVRTIWAADLAPGPPERHVHAVRVFTIGQLYFHTLLESGSVSLFRRATPFWMRASFSARHSSNVSPAAPSTRSRRLPQAQPAKKSAHSLRRSDTNQSLGDAAHNAHETRTVCVVSRCLMSRHYSSDHLSTGPSRPRRSGHHDNVIQL